MGDVAVVFALYARFVLNRLVSLLVFVLGLLLLLLSHLLELALEIRRGVRIAHRFYLHHSLTGIFVLDLLLLLQDLFLLVIEELQVFLKIALVEAHVDHLGLR